MPYNINACNASGINMIYVEVNFISEIQVIKNVIRQMMELEDNLTLLPKFGPLSFIL